MNIITAVYHLIIYCLNCIWRDQNSTYKTGLRFVWQEFQKRETIWIWEIFSKVWIDEEYFQFSYTYVKKES
jgi:hypothetical protein